MKSSIHAILLARAGSKRIPGKNIQIFRGEPLVTWALNAALNWSQFDRVWISTDSHEIKKLCMRIGAHDVGTRSDATSNDHATTADAILEVLLRLKECCELPEYCCALYGSAAFVTPELIGRAYTKMRDENFDLVFPVMRFSYPIWRALRRDSAGHTQFIWPAYSKERSQDLAPAYHDAGQFYFFRTSILMKTGELMAGRVGTIEIAESECQDIDTPEDWSMAELKHARLWPRHAKLA